MEGIQGVGKFSAKAGCQNLLIESKLPYVFAMGTVVLAHSSLKVGFFVFSFSFMILSCVRCSCIAKI